MNKIRVCLVYPPIIINNRPVAQDPPYGLMYIAAMLRKCGIEPYIYDISALRASQEQVLQFFRDNKFDVVGIGGMTTVYYYIKWLSLELKKMYPDLPLVAGGSAATPTPEIIVKNTGIDVAVIGEAEAIIEDLVVKLVGRQDLEDIPGIVYLKGGEPFKTKARPRIKDLDELPYPAYDLVKIREVYLPANQHRQSMVDYCERNGIDRSRISNTFVMFSERGCPFECSFCYRNFGKQFKQHSVDYVINHIKYVMSEFGVNNIAFYDETFNTNLKWLRDFCQRLIDEDLDCYFWAGGARADRFPEDIVDLMRRAKFYEISVGVESFDQRILDAMDKRLNADVLKDCLVRLKKAGMAPSGMGLLFGFKEDTLESINFSIRTVKEIGLPAYFAIPCPFPGATLYDQFLKMGLIPDEEKYMLQLSNMSPIHQVPLHVSIFTDRQINFLVRNAQMDLNHHLFRLRNGNIPSTRLMWRQWKLYQLKNVHFWIGAICVDCIHRIKRWGIKLIGTTKPSLTAEVGNQ